MTQRSILVLLTAIVVLAGLALLGQREGASGSSVQGQQLLPGLAAAINDIDRVVVTKGGNEIVATLERQPETWVVAEKDGYRADVGKLRQALIALGDARILEAKTSNPELYTRLGVEDLTHEGASGVGLTAHAGERELASIILGDSERDYRYVRRAGEAQSYLIDRDPDVPRTAAQWVDSRIIDVRSDRVREVTITHPDGETVHISKASRDATNYEVADVPEGRELMYAGVANVIGNALRELNLEDVVRADAKEPPADGVVRVEFRTFDGLLVTVEGFEEDDQPWVSFKAEAIGAAETETADAGESDAEANADEESSGEATAAVPSASDVAAEAERINASVGGWRYRIASYQYDQMTRRMADLLKAQTNSD
jgi:hypothetical protein